MITLNLRQAIYQRVQDKSDQELLEVIQDSVDQDERTLPGLGVLFEIIWKNSDAELQQELTSILKTNLPHVELAQAKPAAKAAPKRPSPIK
ncbi:small acid-soluble spore protein SspI [Paenibacillus turpanensis]|uniref:small acid-soluble spore protein SspI n=1 Tax=Paenibacillus turpanensis TaxID=2689078 RepID=UPI001A9F6EE4|nr:small acid-soluble spore protein SspI [Paenibacillus turpanensis]